MSDYGEIYNNLHRHQQECVFKKKDFVKCLINIWLAVVKQE